MLTNTLATVLGTFPQTIPYKSATLVHVANGKHYNIIGI